MSDDSELFYAIVLKHGLYSNESNLSTFLYKIFGDISFIGKNVLDIGGGDGLLSFYSVYKGASKAICLEPEAAGSAPGVNQRFITARSALFYEDRVTLLPKTFQEFDPAGEKFDIAVSHASINHLDELACSTILTNMESRTTYLHLFQKLKGMLNPGGVVIICDCSRKNFFQLLGVKNPVAKTIEWDKHQSPSVWTDILKDAGFVEPILRWSSPNSFGAFGDLLLGNRVASYFFDSCFCLSVKNP